MKITGTSSYIDFDLEDGRVIRATGELLDKGKFVVDTDSIVNFNYPYEDEEVKEEQIQIIKKYVQDNTTKETMQIVFD